MNDLLVRNTRLFFLLFVFFQAFSFPFAFAQTDTSAIQADKPSSPAEVQKALTEAGYYKGTIDGIIGTKTRAAIRSFQEDNGLKVDGLVGPNTWAKLKAYLEEAQDMDEENELASIPVEEPTDYSMSLEPEPDLFLTEDDLKQKLIS